MDMRDRRLYADNYRRIRRRNFIYGDGAYFDRGIRGTAVSDNCILNDFKIV